MKNVERVNDICQQVLKLTKEDFKAVEDMANEQLEYVNPLKAATTNKFHTLGKHNLKVLEALKNLHRVLVEGKPD